MAKADDFALEVRRILMEYGEHVTETVAESIQETAEEAAEQLRRTSPGKGSYASGWAVKKGPGLERIVYNATDWQLTHLLENGHVIKNRYGTYGRFEGIRHIGPVEDWAAEELPVKITRGLS